MNGKYDSVYESKKKDITCEIYFIEGIQYNFKLDDMQKLLEIDDLELFKKYLYYLNLHRIKFLYLENKEELLETYISLLDENDITKQKLIKIFLKHENLFCNQIGVRKLENIPTEFKNRKVSYY